MIVLNSFMIWTITAKYIHFEPPLRLTGFFNSEKNREISLAYSTKSAFPSGTS